MANSRFLGLGFTFSAQDRGLEAKLQSISDLIGDISAGLDGANQRFAQMTGPQKIQPRLVMPKTTPMISRVIPPGAPQRGSRRTSNVPRMQPEMFQGVSDSVDDVEKEYNRLEKQLRISEFRMEAVNKEFQSLKVTLGAVKEYFVDLRDASKEFLASLGVDFSKIIPDQFRSAFKLSAATLTGPFKALGKFKEIKKKSGQEKWQDDIRNRMYLLSHQIGGRGTKKDSVVGKLGMIDDNTKKEKKSMIDKLKDLFTNPLVQFGLAVGAIGVAIWGAYEIFKQFTPQIEKSLGGLWESTKLFASAISDAVGAVVDKLTPSLVALWGSMTGFGAALLDVTKSILMKMQPAFDAISDYLSDRLVEVFTSLGTVMDWLIKAVSKTLDFFTGYLNKFSSFLSAPTPDSTTSKSVSRLSDYRDKNPLLDLSTKDLSDKSDALRDSLLQTHKESSGHQKKLIDLQQETNEKLSALIDLQSQTPGAGQKVVLLSDFDSRKFGMQMRQEETDAVGTGRLP